MRHVKLFKLLTHLSQQTKCVHGLVHIVAVRWLHILHILLLSMNLRLLVRVSVSGALDGDWTSDWARVVGVVCLLSN